jgi:hypothetical protein
VNEAIRLKMEENFRGLDVDIEQLAKRSESFFQREGFETNIDFSPEWYRIQAIKKGILRRAVGAARCIELHIRGDPKTFEVEMTTGEWGKNLAASAVMGAVTFGIGWVAAGVSALTYKRLEDKLWDYVQWQVDELRGSAGFAPKPVMEPAPTAIPIRNLSMGLPQCPRCSKRVKPSYRICPYCGFDLASLQTRCPSCTFPIDLSFKLCPNCGTSLAVRPGVGLTAEAERV